MANSYWQEAGTAIANQHNSILFFNLLLTISYTPSVSGRHGWIAGIRHRFRPKLRLTPFSSQTTRAGRGGRLTGVSARER